MTYSELIFTTYFENAIHSAIVVDDEFPTYDLLIDTVQKTEELLAKIKNSKEREGSESENDTCVDRKVSWDYERSSRIYKTFTNRNIPCDIESDVSLLEENIERLRKSDLVVLDYQLDGDGHPPTKALDIIQRLSLNNHFNIVIVNTNEPNLDQVWREVAVTMKNDFDAKKLAFEDIYNGDNWDIFVNDNTLPSLPKDYINAFLEKDNEYLRKQRGKIFADFKALGVSHQDLTNYVEALTYYTLGATISKIPTKGHGLKINCKCNTTDNIRWILNDKVFVVVMGKKKIVEEIEGDDPEQLISHLKLALEDWGPPPIQLLMSNIQNTVEQGSLAYRLDLLRSQKDQTAWLYQALKHMSYAEEAGVEGEEAFFSFNNIISEAVKSSLLNNKNISEFQNKVLMALQEEHGPIPKEAIDRIDYALNICRQDDCTPEDIIRTLNYNLSCFPEIEKRHITTGTIFKKDKEYWVCSSPACDMEPTQHVNHNSWLKGLQPHRPMLALKLQKENDSHMEEAAHGNLLFADNKIFGLVDKGCGVPRPEMFIFENIVNFDNGNKTFKAYQLNKNDAKCLQYSEEEFIVVAQLRPEYAGKLLQKIGTHMSRIGVDFENFPTMYPN